MNPKDFFKLMIRGYALFSLIFGVIYAILSIIPQMVMINYGAVILIGVATILFLMFLVWMTFRYTDSIISFFDLDKGYQSETFQFSNIEVKYCVEIALSLIGFYFIISGIPTLISEAFIYFKDNVQQFNYDTYHEYTFNANYFFSELIGVVIGWAVLKSRKWISKQFM